VIKRATGLSGVTLTAAIKKPDEKPLEPKRINLPKERPLLISDNPFP
jgi:hypothetical protein